MEIGHASEGQTYVVSDTPPGLPSAGDIWFESDTGATFIYFTDANTSQWIEIGHTSDVDFSVYNIDGGTSSSVYGGIATIDCGFSA